MRKNLDLDNCPNKQRTVLTAYLEELEENERKIVDGGAWATSLDLARITHWYPILMKYCPNHPLTQHLKWERNNMKKSKDFADFFFWDWD
jgi:hypothetical protein